MGKNKINNPEKNKEKTNKHEDKISDTSNTSSKGIIIKTLAWIFGGKYLENKEVLNAIPFFLYLIVIGILYITNGNIADKKIREINKLTKEVKELRSEYIITKSELMFLSKQSEIAKKTEALGLKEPIQQPYLILADSTIEIY